MILPIMLLSCVGHRGTIETSEDTYTIAVETGRLLDDGFYKSVFEREAVKMCGEAYEVVYAGRKPDTMQVVTPTNFYWIVRCEN
jgi:hypothetical protein